MKTIRLAVFFCFVVFGNVLVAEEFPPLFPYKVSTETPENILDFSSWNDAPAGKHGFIRVEDGHFVHDAGRFRIWGTNVCSMANFPEKKDAEQFAARIAWLGFNAVRLHHLDNGYIWGPNAKSQLTMDPERLDMFDYFMYHLKNKGIYININLHVSRTMDDRDGFPHKNQRPRYDKGLDNFYRPLIDVQKKYARDLLEHVNPYTKTAYKDEPAVASIEINNENSILRMWGSKELTTMPEPYASAFQKKWNEFLRDKYGSTEKLAKAWKYLDTKSGDEMLAVAKDQSKWRTETGAGAKFEKKVKDKVLTMTVESIGEAERHPQLTDGVWQLDSNKVYRLSLRVRSSAPSSLRVHICQAYDPWEGLGLHDTIAIGPEWKTFTYQFRPRVSEDRARLVLTRFKPGVTEIADVSLRPGGTFGLHPGESLEEGTIPVLAKRAPDRTKEAIDDFCEFLYKIDETYWAEMYRFLKDEIGVRQPVSGTQLFYGSTTAQAALDYVDIHRYWNHPVFVGDNRWENWYIRNRAFVNHADHETLPTVATARVRGKPYTISEFDTPFPCQFGTDALPIMAAFARFHDWDGIYQYSYSHSRSYFASRPWATAAFDMAFNPVKQAHLPAGIAFFRRGDMLTAEKTVRGGLSKEKEIEIIKGDRDTRNLTFQGIGLDPLLSLFYRTELDLTGTSSQEIPSVRLDDLFEPKPPKSGTIHWADRPEGRSFLADSEHSILFSGFSSPDEVFKDRTIGGVDMKLTGKTRLNWTTISLVSIHGNGFGKKALRGDKPVRVLLTATGLFENPDVELIVPAPERVTSEVKNVKTTRWRSEGIPLDVRFRHAGSIRCFALDESGNRREEIETDANGVRLRPGYRTIRYEIEIE